MKKLLSKAIAIASTAHEGVYDKGGSPYILHPIWVMNNVRHLGFKHMIVAILHDVVEDTDWTISKLREEGFPEDVLAALTLLDMRKVNYEDRIKEIATNELAKPVKLKDLEHNLRPSRLTGLSKKDHDKIEKYHRSYVYLNC